MSRWLASLVLLAGVAAGKETAGPGLDDRGFFAEIRLESAGLEAVKEVVGKEDWAAARRAMVEHFKNRRSPRWFFRWDEKVTIGGDALKYRKSDVEAYARNTLRSCGKWHDFGDGLNWNFDLSDGHYREWTWQLNRHPFWSDMGRAYWATGGEKYARAFVAQMNHWVRTQPRPSEGWNDSRSAWRTIETGIRLSDSWPDSFFYFLSSPAFDDESVIRMVKSIYDQAEHLMAHPTSGNWLTMESNGLFCAGALFPEYRRAEAWRKTAIERLYAELNKQVYPDGAQIELTSHYHDVALRNMEMPVRLAALNGLTLPGDYVARLQRMFDYELLISMPNRCMPAVNDSGELDIRGSMEKAAGYYPGRGEYLWIGSDGKQGTAPAQRSVDFPYAGYYVMRSGWENDARYLLLDAGPFGYSHQHEDKLNIIAAAYGRTHVVDFGNFRYDDSPWRKYAIGTFAHNTVLVDGLPQCRRGENRSAYVVKEPQAHEWKTSAGYDWASGVYDEGYGKLRNRIAKHRRQVVFVKAGEEVHATGDYWIVVDTLTPADGGAHTYDAMFHLNADAIEIDPASLRTLTKNKTEANFAIVPAAQAGLSVTNQAGQEKPFLQGWAADWKAGGVRAIPTPVYRLSSTGPGKMVFVLYPLRAGEALAVTGVRTVGAEGGKTARIEIEFGGRGVDRVELTGDLKEPVRVNGR